MNKRSSSTKKTTTPKRKKVEDLAVKDGAKLAGGASRVVYGEPVTFTATVTI